MAEIESVSLIVNGTEYCFEIGKDVESWHTLAYVLREKLGLTGTKISCDTGECGACTVLVDGKAVLSCITPVMTLDGHTVTTIEGLGVDDVVVRAFADQCEPGYGTAMQCGFCTPGFVMSAKGLLNENPSPTEDEIRLAISGNLCRCGTYPAVMRAVFHASEEMKNAGGGSES